MGQTSFASPHGKQQGGCNRQAGGLSGLLGWTELNTDAYDDYSLVTCPTVV